MEELRIKWEVSQLIYLREREIRSVMHLTLSSASNKRRSKAGPNTAYLRQCNEMRVKGVKEPDPRNQILKDLTKIIHEYAAKGYHLMVMGDFNDVRRLKEMEDFMEENNLIDIIRDMHEDEPTQTYVQGS